MFNLVEISKGCAKGLLISLNLLCIQLQILIWMLQLIAICTFGFAVVDTKILKQYGEEQAAGSFAGDMVIIAVSVLMVLVATFGCIGAARDNSKMLYLYICFLMVLVLLELLIAIFVSVQRYGLQFRITDWLREDFFRNVTDDRLASHIELWDDLQTTYECCGLNGPEDYVAMGQPVSLSCCPRAARARTANAQQNLYRACIDSASYYTEGCEDEILYILQADADWLLGVAVVSFWFEAVSMLLAMWIANHLKNSVQVYKHTVKY